MHKYFMVAIAGFLLPLGFAPFHLAGMPIIALAILYHALLKHPRANFLLGFIFGTCAFSFGVSWIFVSIQNYGHLSLLLSLLITIIFIAYLALFPALVTLAFGKLNLINPNISMLLFSSLWCLSEWLRAHLIGGFPWLLLGFGQMDSGLSNLSPIIGIYGVSFIVVWLATLLQSMVTNAGKLRHIGAIVIVLLMLLPNLHQWTKGYQKISVGVVQANLSMRDKWDENLFWQIVTTYSKATKQLLKQVQIVVMPETAIPVPANYLANQLDSLAHIAKQKNSAILLGIPQSDDSDTNIYNTITALGNAEGQYRKQHLVPFGEYIPRPFSRLITWLGVPQSNLFTGQSNQSLLKVLNMPVAAAICYELAFPNLLRQQLPQAAWIVSLTDDGWFGHSLAMYQHLQMAQALSLQTGRYQVLANNNGLSSLIDSQGKIINSLPAYATGSLTGEIIASTGATPWVIMGDKPVILLCLLLLVFALPLAERGKRGYAYQPN